MDKKVKEILREERDRIQVELDQVREEFRRITEQGISLKKEIDGINKLIGEEHSTADSAVGHPPVTHAPVTGAVLDVLRRSGKPMRLEEVVRDLVAVGMDKINPASVRTALVRLADVNPQVIREERGLYKFVGPLEAARRHKDK